VSDDRKAAELFVEELGNHAGYVVGVLAHSSDSGSATREQLMGILAEIERLQGYGWYFE
jgi:hypothetical protein